MGNNCCMINNGPEAGHKESTIDSAWFLEGENALPPDGKDPYPTKNSIPNLVIIDLKYGDLMIRNTTETKREQVFKHPGEKQPVFFDEESLLPKNTHMIDQEKLGNIFNAILNEKTTLSLQIDTCTIEGELCAKIILPLIQHHPIHKLHLNIWTPSVKSGLRHRGAGHSYLNMSNIMQSLHRFFLRRTFTMKVTFVDHAYYLYDHSVGFFEYLIQSHPEDDVLFYLPKVDIFDFFTQTSFELLDKRSFFHWFVGDGQEEDKLLGNVRETLMWLSKGMEDPGGSSPTPNSSEKIFQNGKEVTFPVPTHFREAASQAVGVCDVKVFGKKALHVWRLLHETITVSTDARSAMYLVDLEDCKDLIRHFDTFNDWQRGLIALCILPPLSTPWNEDICKGLECCLENTYITIFVQLTHEERVVEGIRNLLQSPDLDVFISHFTPFPRQHFGILCHGTGHLKETTCAPDINRFNSILTMGLFGKSPRLIDKVFSRAQNSFLWSHANSCYTSIYEDYTDDRATTSVVQTVEGLLKIFKKVVKSTQDPNIKTNFEDLIEEFNDTLED